MTTLASNSPPSGPDTDPARAASAYALVCALQRHMVDAMQRVALAAGHPTALVASEWLRDGGRHGGGVRWGTGDTAVFNRASVNVSQVHYADEPDKPLASATALSTIIHPANPHAPSVHMHISWTQLRGRGGYWRIMADLNPAIAASVDASSFEECLSHAAPTQYAYAAEQGARYFWIPALERHRGVAHFYLEGYDSGDFTEDATMARELGHSTIDTYAALVSTALSEHPEPSARDYEQQLAYHTAYLFQVLTLDRGTTSGLLIHDQNDLGILGSLPSHIDAQLLASWAVRAQPPQDELVRSLVSATAGGERCLIDDATKRALATTVRQFYRAHPEALAMQAAGDIIPPTVANHR